MKIKKSKTERGFKLITFEDKTGVKCNIQKSSLAFVDAIWFGAEDIGLKKHFNGKFEDIDTVSNNGVSYIANNRMHLTQKQVKKLLPILQHFAETGELK